MARLQAGSRENPPRIITQVDVGEALGLTGVTVGRWEGDRSEPPLAQLSALARVLGVREVWLILGYGPMLEDQGAAEYPRRVAEPAGGGAPLPSVTRESMDPAPRGASATKPARKRRRGA